MSENPKICAEEIDYPLGAVVRMTGLSAHTIRAWERRYGAVQPRRTEGGTRRYAAVEVARLRLLRAATEAGYRIGDLAGLPDAAIEARLAPLEDRPGVPLPQLEEALARLDLGEVERTLGLQLSALGPAAFARDVAGPLLRDMGERWERGEVSIAAEHLVSSATRGILADALRAGSFAAGGTPRILFTTPEGEPHEFGALIAAVTAVAAGAAATYLGPQLPTDEVAGAVAASGARVVALGVITLPLGAARRYLTDLRERLSAATEIWVGGTGPIDGVPGVDHIDLDELGRRISRLQRLPTSAEA
ncbi:MAG: MerR family transcriptional regulator [Deltaproteobacteria bacterium]|nr:MAG: MerR family transcriptional regulator [Deltaproteobacteria bacterium]